jgi:hypothetical protein
MTGSGARAPGWSGCGDAAAAVEAGLLEVTYPGHPYYLMTPGGPGVHHRPQRDERGMRVRVRDS